MAGTKIRSLWDQAAGTYESDVFHLTKYPRAIEKVMAHIRRGKVLDLGCGPLGHMLGALAAHGCDPMGLDISPTMVRETKKHFKGRVVCDDARGTALESNFFDSVVSINSILPEERPDVLKIFAEVHRVLKPGGRLVAFLPSYDYVTKLAESGLPVEQDPHQFRVRDTTGWQCFYTEETIRNLMSATGYAKWELAVEVFDGKEVLADMKRIYGFDFSELPVEEYFLVATK
ncbi:MAG: hypothetical protein BMS9Abin13_410 [Patescibacteria group bacterium]|nr:MAG: hypothetical protein BMS9Abin13_410 [Patescibacteria group bacterium]